jgi:hypothetical protein
MSGGMPYQLEKGPYFSVTESMIAAVGTTPATRLALLQMIIGSTSHDGLPSLESTSLDAGPQNQEARRDHMNEHWYGKTFDRTTGQWIDQPAFDLLTNRTTGYWMNWYGDAEGIVQQTFVRALEVSLGIDHITPSTNFATIVPTRCWPIEVFWRCPAPWMEGWVTWRRESDGSGHVTVHIHTPSHEGSRLLLSPIRTPPDSQRPDYMTSPTQSDMDRGMWVIAHEVQTQYPVYSSSTPSGVGDFQLPTFGPVVESHGDIVTVQPNEPDGGVLANGRAFTPPST